MTLPSILFNKTVPEVDVKKHTDDNQTFSVHAGNLIVGYCDRIAE